MRVLVATFVAMLAATTLPAREAVVPVGLSIAMPTVAAATGWAARRMPRLPVWLPRPLLLGDVLIAGGVVLSAPPLRAALAILLVPLFTVAVRSSRPADLTLVGVLAAGTWWGMLAAPLPGRAVFVTTVTAAAVTVAIQGRQLDRAVRGGSRRIAFLSGRSRAMLRGVSEALVVTTPSGRILDGNQQAVDLAGTRGLVGRTCAEALGLHRDHQLLDCSTCPLADHPGEDVELWAEAPDGDHVTLLARVQPIVDRTGRTVELLHSLRDISEIARAREAENTFLATASHELKTPLTVIRGSAETLAARPGLPDEVRLRLLEAILGKSAELDAMVGRLLQASRAGAGALQPDLEEVDVPALLVGRVLEMDAASPDHVFTWEQPDRVPLARADAEAVATIVDHLLENARKYQPDGGEVRIRVGVTDEHVLVAVQDHGIGMTLEQQRRCFDRFWQGRTGDRRRFGGTGVGLYLVRELAHAQGGAVTVESRPGVGSTFTVRLPRADAAPTPGGAPGDGPHPGRSMIEEFMGQVGVTPVPDDGSRT